MLVTSMNTNQLISILEENRNKHRRVFEAALEGWRKEALKRVNRAARELREDSGQPDLRKLLLLSAPKDHTDDYDRVIRQIKAHQGETIDLDEATYAQYVEDSWRWRRDFLTVGNNYAPETVQAEYAEVPAGDE